MPIRCPNVPRNFQLAAPRIPIASQSGRRKAPLTANLVKYMVASWPAKQKVPDSLDCREDFAQTGAGKVHKDVLRAKAAAGGTSPP